MTSLLPVPIGASLPLQVNPRPAGQAKVPGAITASLTKALDRVTLIILPPPPPMAGWCVAERVDVEYLIKRPDWQTYVVRASKEMRAENLDFVYATGEKDVEGDCISFFTSEENLQDATFQQVGSDKAVRAMAHAMNTLKHPISAPRDSPIDPKSIRASKYLLRFEKEGDVDILGKFDGLARVRQGSAPAFVMKEFYNMDGSKREAFTNLGKLPTVSRSTLAELHVASRRCTSLRSWGFTSVPARLTRRLKMRSQLTTSFYVVSSCYPRPHPKTPARGQCNMANQSCQRVEASTAPCCRMADSLTRNNNSAVETFAMNLKKKFDNLELGPNAPDIVRLYGMAREVGYMLQRTREDITKSQRSVRSGSPFPPPNAESPVGRCRPGPSGVGTSASCYLER